MSRGVLRQVQLRVPHFSWHSILCMRICTSSYRNSLNPYNQHTKVKRSTLFTRTDSEFFNTFTTCRGGATIALLRVAIFFRFRDYAIFCVKASHRFAEFCRVFLQFNIFSIFWYTRILFVQRFVNKIEEMRKSVPRPLLEIGRLCVEPTDSYRW